MKRSYPWQLLKNKAIGSTLIELLIVVTLIAILATLAIPSWKFLKHQQIIEQLNQLQIICTTSQQKATSTQEKQTLTFEPNAHNFFFNQHTEKLLPGVSFGFLPGLKGPPSHPKKPITQAITFPDQTITFYPDGTISAGTIYLINQQKEQYALTVPISKATFARKYRYQNNQWICLK